MYIRYFAAEDDPNKEKPVEDVKEGTFVQAEVDEDEEEEEEEEEEDEEEEEVIKVNVMMTLLVGANDFSSKDLRRSIQEQMLEIFNVNDIEGDVNLDVLDDMKEE